MTSWPSNSRKWTLAQPPAEGAIEYGLDGERASLAPGEDAQVLTLTGGYPAWGALPMGMTPLVRDSSRYYPVPFCGPAAALSSANTSQNIIRTHLWLVQDTCTLDAVAIQVLTANASGLLRLGLYADDGAGAPGALLADFGQLSAATIGVKVISGLSVVLQGGVPYHFAVWANSNISCRALQLSGHVAWLGLDASLGTAPGIGWAGSLTYTTAYPSTFPSGATVTTGTTATPFARFSS